MRESQVHTKSRPCARRRGASVLELLVVVSILSVLTAPMASYGTSLQRRFRLDAANEEAARLLARARWVAVSNGGAAIDFTAEPPMGVVTTVFGDTVLSRSLGEGGVSLTLSRGRETSRVRFGPLGLGRVSSQTLTFSIGAEERRLVISSLGRITRR